MPGPTPFWPQACKYMCVPQLLGPLSNLREKNQDECCANVRAILSVDCYRNWKEGRSQLLIQLIQSSTKTHNYVSDEEEQRSWCHHRYMHVSRDFIDLGAAGIKNK